MRAFTTCLTMIFPTFLAGCVAGTVGGPGDITAIDETAELLEGLDQGYGDDEASSWDGDGWGMGGGGEPGEEPVPGEEDDGDPVPLSYGGGPELGGADPGEGGGAHIADPCRFPHRAGYHLINGTPGPDHLPGTEGPDLIFGLGGNDVIIGKGGNDIICAGAGADEIHGGHGRDYIDAGLGRDVVRGGPDGDVIHGRNGGDRIWGGAGNDFISGDLLDDDLYGEAGDDVIIGGHGTDYLHGGDQSDYLRGDTGHDTFVGGEGVDTISFMTATPPGQPRNDTAAVTQDGMLVDLSDKFCGTEEGELRSVGWDGCMLERWDGLASGDGFREALRGVERVVGSPFNDLLIGGAGTQALFGGEGDDSLQTATELNGGPGADLCNGAPCEGAAEVSRAAGPYVTLDARPDDVGLVVIGASGIDSLTISMNNAREVRVTVDLDAVLAPGPGCERDAAGDYAVVCTAPSALRYVVAYGDDGDDYIAIEDGFPRDMTAHIDGGLGSDVLEGSDGEDVLFGGRMGYDSLFGQEGDDALLSESRNEDRALPGDQYGGGADLLDGGLGNDQLVSDYPCGTHRFRGGRGTDIAGFARSADLPIYAQLGGEADDPKEFRGYAYNPDRCGFIANGTHLDPGLEILEGADGADRLFGNRDQNVIWAWGGADYVGGDGGDDVLEGHLGADEILGEGGADTIRGGGDYDTLRATDSRPDRNLSCGFEPNGDNGGRLYRDAGDPNGMGCAAP